MKLLFVGLSWNGSDARSLREALARQPGIQLEEIAIDLTVPVFDSRLLRALNRALLPLEIQELKRRTILACRNFRPDAILVYKGAHLDADFIGLLKDQFAPVINVFPDASPHAHGALLRKAIGAYDLVISRKTYHPPRWSELYGYSNRCVHVGHGYMPTVHLRVAPPTETPYDVVVVANGREEYAKLLRTMSARLGAKTCGSRWAARTGKGAA